MFHADGSIRLAGGKGSHEGRLEVFHTAQWGTVCDDGWNDMNTHVVCRQLGFKSLTDPIVASLANILVLESRKTDNKH
ncbi:hypothetical protein AB205_0097460 [Aquarana catesbeiana]|uniref:SRCR domain-containing protein n=1 Tax=Aquarana catesbeiana TaxID=8400 RepID=A0A2G9NH13_AQUCT|nr:hypothetical protein AB205_0097460 [Aquarana catesbeiana]